MNSNKKVENKMWTTAGLRGADLWVIAEKLCLFYYYPM